MTADHISRPPGKMTDFGHERKTAAYQGAATYWNLVRGDARGVVFMGLPPRQRSIKIYAGTSRRSLSSDPATEIPRAASQARAD